MEYSLAARLISQLHGPAPRAAMTLSDDELQPVRCQPPILGESGAIVRTESQSRAVETREHPHAETQQSPRRCDVGILGATPIPEEAR